MEVSLDDPIEYLRLSNRTRNALRRMGCDTVGSLMNRGAGPPSLRSGFGFGPVSRAEAARALAASGITPWAQAMTAEDRLAALRAQMQASFQQWATQIEILQTRFANPTESEHSGRRRSGKAAKPYAELAEQFKTPLTLICTASAGLLMTKALSPEQRELAELIEKESARLRDLLHGLLETP